VLEKTREFHTQSLHYFFKSDNKSNHHHESCNDPAKLLNHHVLSFIQRFMDKASPGGAYLIQRKGGLLESILIGSDEKIILACNSAFFVKEVQMNTLKNRIDGSLCGDHNLSTSLWVSNWVKVFLKESLNLRTTLPLPVTTPLTHPLTQDPPQLGRDPGTTEISCPRLCLFPLFPFKPGIYWSRGTVKHEEPPSLGLYPF